MSSWKLAADNGTSLAAAAERPYDPCERSEAWSGSPVHASTKNSRT
ncbi:hypothetical protein [Streptomyces lincolnensis]